MALGNIVIPSTTIATVSGNVVNCTGASVTNGYVILNKGGVNFYQLLDNTGSFDFTTTLCSGNTSVSLVAEDLTALQGSNTTTFTITPGTNPVGTINACGNSIAQYINYTINGTNYAITSPADSLAEALNTQSIPQVFYVSGYAGNSNTPVGSVGPSANFTITNTGIAAGSTQDLQGFFTRQINDSTSMLTPIAVNITEYGVVGQFIAGNFTGTLTGAAPANTPYNVTCNFRVRRNQ